MGGRGQPKFSTLGENVLLILAGNSIFSFVLLFSTFSVFF